MKWSFFHRQSSTYSATTILKWLCMQFKVNRIQSTLNMFIGLCVVALDFFFVWCTKLCIDIATGQSNRFTLSFVAFLLISTILLQIILSFAGRWVRAVLGVQAQNRMQKTIFTHILMSEWSSIEKFHSGDILNRIEKDVTDIVTFVTESLPSLITTIVQFSGAFIFLFILDRTLACVVVVLLPFFIIISRIYVNEMHRLTRSIRQTDSHIQSIIQESIQHRTVVKALQQSQLLLSRLSLVQDDLSQQVRQKTKYSSISSTIVNLGFAAGYLFAFLWGVHGLHNHSITYGALIAFIQLVGQIQNPTRNLTRYIPIFISTLTASERLLQLMDMPSETTTHNLMLHGPLGIRLSQVDYNYNENVPIFQHFSYDFAPGSSTIIMGETGAGKSTLVRLLLALFQPQKGSIEIYNNNQHLGVDTSTRTNFSYVPQGNTLYSGTIRHNLHLSDPSATTEQMVRALHLACADFVFELPDNIDTYCGEQGFGLSEGQAQRVCLARAFLRPGPILLLDEATSALDIQTETQILQNIQQFFSDRTLIIVSHHEHVASFCTQKLVLEKIQNPLLQSSN